MRVLTKSLFLALTLLAAAPACAQWLDIAHHLVAGPTACGAMHYKDGILWAGNSNLFYSEDTGRTWKNSVLPISLTGWMTDISFLNKDTGIIAVGSDIFKTTDRGRSWTTVPPPAPNLFWSRLIYRASPPAIYACNPSTLGQVCVSTNDGQTWSSTYLYPDPTCITIAPNGTLYAFAYGTVFSSSTNGTRWDTLGTVGQINLDCFTIDIDSCNSNEIYLLNENFAQPGDGASKIWTSSDGGLNWKVAFSHPTRFFSGSLAVSRHAIFAPTWDEGIYRSTDHGATWTNCAPPQPGGPLNNEDARSICPINDNLVFVLDPWGTIWMTNKSGVDSLKEENFSAGGTLSVAHQTLFDRDTLYPCADNSIAGRVAIQTIGCYPPAVESATIEGADSASYRISSVGSGSIIGTFQPTSAGQHGARLIITVSDGTRDTVALAGFGMAVQPMQIVTNDETLDTLGSTVSIPFTFTGMSNWADVDLVVHYDPSLIYLGSFSPSDQPLDLNDRWPGGSRIGVRAQNDIIAGYARFETFHDSASDPRVTFDSVRIISRALAPCELSDSLLAISVIHGPPGCQVPMISRYVHGGAVPQLSIYPNPASNQFSVVSSADMGGVVIALYDMLGGKRSETSADLKAGTPLTISPNAGAGIYELRVSSVEARYNLRLVIQP